MHQVNCTLFNPLYLHHCCHWLGYKTALDILPISQGSFSLKCSMFFLANDNQISHPTSYIMPKLRLFFFACSKNTILSVTFIYNSAS